MACRMIKDTDLFDILNVSGNGNLIIEIRNTGRALQIPDVINKFTVFAPTNAAFESMKFDMGSFFELTDAERREIAEYHILSGREVMYGDLGCGTSYDMLNGVTSRTECRGNGGNRKYQVGARNVISNLPLIVERNMDASNGVIHLVDEVLLPPRVGLPCDIAAEITCTIVEPSDPKNRLDCTDLDGDVKKKCPDDEELFAAFLVYDGNEGDNVFVSATCLKDEKVEFFVGPVKKDEIFQVNASAKDCMEGKIKIDIKKSEGGAVVETGEAVIACLGGPWTIGDDIIPGLKLAYYASTKDSEPFRYNFFEPEVQIDYVAFSASPTPLTVTGFFSGETPFTEKGVFSDVRIPALGRETLMTEKKKVKLQGPKQIPRIKFGLNLFAETLNEPTIICLDTTQYQKEL